MARSTVAVRFTGDVSSLKGSIGDAEGRLAGFGSKVAGAGKAMALGLGVGVAGAVALGSEVLDLGGKLTAWRQKTDTVFEGQASAVRKWADSNNEAFGLTDDELAGLAASFGDLLKPMGFTADQAADMSTDVVGLSGALSAWSGGQRTAAEVSEILAKAMLGERDGLKELGISISEADVQGRLAAKGQKDLTGAALEQAKALATQELIFEKSTDAQKAYAEGGNEALTASNKLKAGIGELKERIADGLLPTVIRVAEVVGSAFGRAMDLVGPFFNTLRSGFTEDEGTPVENFALRVRTAIEGVVTWVQENWPKIRDTIVPVVETIAEVVGGILTVLRVAWENFGNNILEFVQRVWPAIQQVIEGALNIIQGIVKTITSLIQGDWAGVWEGIKQIVSGAWNAIQGIIKAALEAIRGIVGIALEILGSVFKGAWDAIKNAVSTALGAVIQFHVEMPGRILRAIGDVGSLLFDVGKKIVQGLLDGLKSMVGKVKDFFGNLTDMIPDWKGPEDKDASLLTKSGQLVMQSFLDGLRAVAPQVEKYLQAFTSGLPGSMSLDQLYAAIGELEGTSAEDIRLGGGGNATAESMALRAEMERMQSGGTVRYGSVSDAEWERLKSAGWKGRAGDGMEALYAPSSSPAVIVLQLDGRELGRVTIDNLLALGKSDGIQYLNAG